MPDVSLPPTHPDDELVTRKILREELSKFATKDELSNHPTKDDLREALSNYPTKEDLREALSNYPTKADLREELSNYPTKADLREELSKFATKEELSEALATFRADLTQDFNGMHEHFLSELRGILDPLEGTPDRVQKLERQFEGHEVRIASLEAPKRARRTPTARAKRKRR